MASTISSSLASMTAAQVWPPPKPAKNDGARNFPLCCQSPAKISTIRSWSRRMSDFEITASSSLAIIQRLPPIELPQPPLQNGNGVNVAGSDPWPTMEQAAFHGLAGDFVRAIEPHTESDPVGLLVQFLVTFGNIVGHRPYF